MRRFVLILACLGTLLFGGVFVLSWAEPLRIEQAARELLRADCECRRRMVSAAQQAAAEHLQSLLQMRERLDEMIEHAYAQVTRQLLRELRIFSASNALAFALLLGLAAWRRSSGRQLLLAALVLVGAVGVTGGLYLFNQNWLHTLVFGSYVGLAYAAWLAALVLLLGDLAFNRARLTNALFSVVGTASPC